MAESEIIFAVQESPEGGYEAKALGYSIYTQADTLDELKECSGTPFGAISNRNRARESYGFI